MELELIKKFIELVKGTDIEELNWERNGTKIAFKREPDVKPDKPVKKDIETKTVPTDKTESDKKEPGLKPLLSTMVGTFYRSLPDRPPLVMEGEHIVPGQKIAIIETMKIIKDVVSDVKGKIVKVVVDNGKPVEYGQELFLVELTEKGEGK